MVRVSIRFRAGIRVRTRIGVRVKVLRVVNGFWGLGVGTV